MRLRKRSSAGAIHFEAFGVAAEVAYNAAELEPHVRALLPPGWTSARDAALAGHFELRREPDGGCTLTVGGRPLIERAALEMVLGRLDSEIRMLIATTAPGLVFVHAGVVAVGQRALIIPGKSFTGKTTLVRALVQAGAAYYSDEYAVLDESGNVLPYPRRLSIRASGGAPARHAHVSELGGVVGSAPTTVGTVAITRFRPGSVWSPQPVSRGAGALALLENTVPARARPQAALQAITQALSGARVLIGDRGEADATARALIQVIAS